LTRAKHTIGETGLAIIGETDNINYFVETELTPDSIDGVENKTSTKAGCNRRRYKGDPEPYTVKGHSYTYLYDPGRIDLQTLPGRPVILKANGETRQFTFIGDVKDLHAWLVGDASYDTKVYTEGPPYQIKASTDVVAV